MADAPVTTPAATAPVTPATPAAAAADPKAAAAAPVTPPAEGAKAADPAKPAAEPTKAEIRRLKLKLDGADIDLSEDEVIQLAQQSGAAQKRFMEASAVRKQNEELVAFLKANPIEAMRRLGLDPRKISEEHLVAELKKEAESPEAKQIREANEKIRGYEAKEKAQQEARAKWEAEQKDIKEKADAEQKKNDIIKRYDEVFTAALAESGCQKNAYTVRRMAELQRINLKNKLDLSPASLAKMVKEDVEGEVKHHVGDRTGEQLMEFLGPELIKRITRAQIAKLKGNPVVAGGTPPPSNVAEADDPNKPKTWREFSRRGRMSRT